MIAPISNLLIAIPSLEIDRPLWSFEQCSIAHSRYCPGQDSSLASLSSSSCMWSVSIMVRAPKTSFTR